MLESKIPSESLSSTSGVKSAELSDTEEGKETSSSSNSNSLTKLPVTGMKVNPVTLPSRSFQQQTAANFPFIVNESSAAGHSQPRLPLIPRIPAQAQYFQFVPSQTPYTALHPYTATAFYRN